MQMWEQQLDAIVAQMRPATTRLREVALSDELDDTEAPICFGEEDIESHAALMTSWIDAAAEMAGAE